MTKRPRTVTVRGRFRHSPPHCGEHAARLPRLDDPAHLHLRHAQALGDPVRGHAPSHGGTDSLITPRTLVRLQSRKQPRRFYDAETPANQSPTTTPNPRTTISATPPDQATQSPAVPTSDQIEHTSP